MPRSAPLPGPRPTVPRCRTCCAASCPSPVSWRRSARTWYGRASVPIRSPRPNSVTPSCPGCWPTPTWSTGRATWPSPGRPSSSRCPLGCPVASEITLSLLIGAVQPSPVPREVMESLVSASVQVSATGKSGFDLSFAVSKGSPLLTDLLPAGYFDPPTRVILVVTMAGSATVLMDGVITFQEMVPSDEPGKAVLSIKGDDLTRMLDLVDLTGFPWPAMPAEARVAIAVGKYIPLYGIVPIVIPSVLIDVPNPVAHIPVQRGTDLKYIKTLADRVGYVFFIQPGPLPGMNLAYWGPMLRTAIPFLPVPPPIAIDWDGASNVESLQFSFDGFAKTQWVVVIQVGSIPVPIPVPDINPISPPLGRKSPIPLKI